MEPIGETPDDTAINPAAPTIGDLIRWYSSTGRRLKWGRSKSDHLRFLQRQAIAKLNITNLSAEPFVDHVRQRRLKGVKPETAMLDLELLRVVFRATPDVIGPTALPDLVNEALAMCKSTNIVSKAPRRDRRPTLSELSLLDHYFPRRRNGGMPMQDILWFAIYSARSEGEICQLLWNDLDSVTRTGLIPDSGTQHRSSSNGRRFRFTEQAWSIAHRQPRTDRRIFPFHPQSIGKAFRLACHELQIVDLRFQDLRYEATLRVFENGCSIHQVAHITLNDSPNTLKRYARFVRERPAFPDSVQIVDRVEP